MSQGILASAEASRMRKAPSLRSLQPPAAGARVAALRAARVAWRGTGTSAGRWRPLDHWDGRGHCRSGPHPEGYRAAWGNAFAAAVHGERARLLRAVPEQI